MDEKHSEKEKITLDSLSPKFNRGMIAYHETGDLFADTCEIVESAQSIAYAAVDTILVQRNWLLGKRIAIECLNQRNSFGRKLKFRRDFIIYRRKKTEKIKIFKV